MTYTKYTENVSHNFNQLHFYKLLCTPIKTICPGLFFSFHKRSNHMKENEMLCFPCFYSRNSTAVAVL